MSSPASTSSPFLDAVTAIWDDDILPALTDYVRIPALSPAFDDDWAAHGRLSEAVRLMVAWVEARRIPGCTVEVVERRGLTPLIVVEIPATGDAGAADTVLFYGHYDKQPPGEGWHEGLGPWSPVIRDGRLYGRGGADDGYALFGSLAAVEAVRAAGAAHARCLIVIEGSEESGSPHLSEHLAALAPRIGTPSLVVCLDSGCADYERLWVTTSLRGLVAGTLRVAIAREGRHSGAVGGAVPSTFRIARGLLDRVEDVATGTVRLPAAVVDIPAERVAQAARLVELIGDGRAELPLLDGVDLSSRPAAEAELDRTWRAALAVIGADGMPPTAAAGNVLRPMTALKLSLRLPPTADADAVSDELRRVLVTDPPYGATVTFEPDTPASGWNAPPLEPWLSDALAAASRASFGRELGFMGEGGTIPLMGTLQRSFPHSQLVVIGVLGPDSNAHGPNEFLHLATGRRLTASVADLLVAHAGRPA